MVLNIVLTYYLLSLIYVIVLVVLRKRGVGLQAMILIACPFLSLLILYAMSKKPNRNGELPDWLLRREQYEDFALRSPDIDKEINIVPFDDALMLNDNKTKRKMLMDLLKGEFMQHVDALEHALQNEDSETSHYAATAVQKAKSDLLKNMRNIEMNLEKKDVDYELLASYRDVLDQYIKIEFLDQYNRKKYAYTYLHTLDQLIQLSPKRDAGNYQNKIRVALTLGEHGKAADAATQFLATFPNDENAYFSAMNVHYKMYNELDFKQVMNRLTSSGIRLSPNRLNQLRFWIQGDPNEQQI